MVSGVIQRSIEAQKIGVSRESSAKHTLFRLIIDMIAGAVSIRVKKSAKRDNLILQILALWIFSFLTRACVTWKATTMVPKGHRPIWEETVAWGEATATAHTIQAVTTNTLPRMVPVCTVVKMAAMVCPTATRGLMKVVASTRAEEEERLMIFALQTKVKTSGITFIMTSIARRKGGVKRLQQVIR